VPGSIDQPYFYHKLKKVAKRIAMGACLNWDMNAIVQCMTQTVKERRMKAGRGDR
jgi:hypothetical protein